MCAQSLVSFCYHIFDLLYILCPLPTIFPSDNHHSAVSNYEFVAFCFIIHTCSFSLRVPGEGHQEDTKKKRRSGNTINWIRQAPGGYWPE